MPRKKSSIKNRRRSQVSKVKGKLAERWVAIVLWLYGWRLLATNLKTPQAEIDLLCNDGNGLVIVEVKYRSSNRGIPFTDSQLSRLARAAQAIQNRLRRSQSYHRQGIRIDLILLVRDGWRIQWHHYRGLIPRSKCRHRSGDSSGY